MDVHGAALLSILSIILFWETIGLTILSTEATPVTPLPSIQHVYLPSGHVTVPNASAYVFSVGDVKDDYSVAQVTFDVPPTDHPIVIYGVKRFLLPKIFYVSIVECPLLRVYLKAGDVTAHEFSLPCDLQRDKDYLANIHRYKVFVKGVTHVEVQLEFRLFGNKSERPKKDAFEVFFVAADNGACQDGVSPRGWCSVEIKDLLNLEEIAGPVPDLSRVHKSPICMDRSVAKELFNTTCLEVQPSFTLDVITFLFAMLL